MHNKIYLEDYIDRLIQISKTIDITKKVVEHLTICDEWLNLESLTKLEWLNRIPQKLDVEEFDTFSTNLFRAVRDRLNNKSK